MRVIRKIRLVLLPIFLFGCGEPELLKIANDGRFHQVRDLFGDIRVVTYLEDLFVARYSKIYDCRSQGRTPWADSLHSEVIVHLLDFERNTELLHRGYYANTILDDSFSYKLRTEEDENHRFEQFFYDLTRIEHSSNFINFRTKDVKGNLRRYAINKKTDELVYDGEIPKEYEETMTRLKRSKDWLKKNLGLSWVRNCRKI